MHFKSILAIILKVKKLSQGWYSEGDIGMTDVEPKLFIQEKLQNNTFIISIDDISIVRPESSLFL